VLRTYPYRRNGYPFAPAGERSAARGYGKALSMARNLIYVEDQYLWSDDVAAPFAAALAAHPDLRLIAVLPAFTDTTGMTRVAESIGRRAALASLQAAGGDRVAVYGLENAAGTPIYVHAKTTVIDDTWTSVGSDNLNMRSWTHDSEVSCAVIDDPVAEPGSASDSFGQRLRLMLMREHLGRSDTDDEDLRDGRSAFDAFRASAQALDVWHQRGGVGPRPAGQLRAYVLPASNRLQRALAVPLYRWICDPDGRQLTTRRRSKPSDVS
jgi:phosphatidylserine/phosphatidylglycerophosphate/cardiolipin synthase-like enzyme